MSNSSAAPALASFAIERHQLDNGLTVILQPDRELPLVTVNLWYHVGSKNESPGHTGLAHLFEHMLFQGSQHVDTNDHFGYIQKVGGIANGSTTRDRTNYFETLPAGHLELGLWLESDRMGFLLPAMTPDKLENQRQVVMNERRQRTDNQPYGLASERLWELLYPGDHPYSWPVIGYMDDIAGATLDEVQHFFESWYRPNNAVLTLAGDFEPRVALDAVERFFGPLPAGDTPPRPAPVAVAATGEQRAVLGDDVQLPRVYFAYRAAAYGDPAWYATDLLTTVLADGKSSPLYESLVLERQVAQNIAVWSHETELPGALMVAATAQPGVGAEQLEAAVEEELARATAAPPAPQHLERALNRTRARAYAELQSLGRRADLLSQYTTFFDQPELLGREVERYDGLDAAALAAAAERWLQPDNRVVVTVVPRGDAAAPAAAPAATPPPPETTQPGAVR
jgi:zinc protease